MSVAPPWWATMIASAIVGSFFTLIGTWILRRSEKNEYRETNLGLIRYYLRRLEQLMGVMRQDPDARVYGFENIIDKLAGLVFSGDAFLMLNKHEKLVVSEAISVAEESLGYIQADLRLYRENPVEYQEYLRAAAQRALRKIICAREILKDFDFVDWPSDPRNLHRWPMSGKIPRE